MSQVKRGRIISRTAHKEVNYSVSTLDSYDGVPAVPYSWDFIASNASTTDVSKLGFTE